MLTALRELESRQLPRRKVPRVAVVHEQPPVRRWGALVSVANLHLRPRRVCHIRRPSVEYPRVLQPDVALLEGVAHGLLEERRDVRLLLLDDVVESTVEQQPVVIFVQIESVLSTRQKPASESTEELLGRVEGVALTSSILCVPGIISMPAQKTQQHSA